MLKRTYAILITLLLWTLVAVPVPVQGESITNSDGYVSTEGGYYLLPSTGTLYTRSAYTAYYWVDGYYYTTNCCRYWQPGYWQGYTAYKYSVAMVNVEAPDIESQLVTMAKARDAGVLKIAAASQKSASALALADKLGLNVAIPNYGAGIFPIPQHGAQLVTTAAASGNTAYGYQQLTLDVKGVDDTILAQALAQAQADGGLYLDKAHERLAAAEARRVLLTSRAYQTAIIGAAASQLAREAGKAVQPKSDVKVEQITKMPVVVDQPNVANQGAAFLALSGPSQCIRCHGDKGVAQAKFDITLYNPQTAPEADVDRVVAYLTSTDPKASCGTASGRTKLGFKEQAQFLKR